MGFDHLDHLCSSKVARDFRSHTDLGGSPSDLIDSGVGQHWANNSVGAFGDSYPSPGNAIFEMGEPVCAENHRNCRTGEALNHPAIESGRSAIERKPDKGSWRRCGMCERANTVIYGS
jgi:hypothetical protein